MTNEIKEIIEYLKDKNIYIEEHDYCYKRLSLEECNTISNYITNLQEENEKYKKIFEGKERFSKIMPDDMEFIILSKADYDRQQEDIELTAIELKQRIDKAINYILENICCDTRVYTKNENVYKVVDILRGDE